MRASTYVPLGRMAEHKPAHPERTAYRAGAGVFSDYEVKTWTSEGAMREACRMSDTGKLGSRPWKPWNESRFAGGAR